MATAQPRRSATNSWLHRHRPRSQPSENRHNLHASGSGSRCRSETKEPEEAEGGTLKKLREGQRRHRPYHGRQHVLPALVFTTTTTTTSTTTNSTSTTKLNPPLLIPLITSPPNSLVPLHPSRRLTYPSKWLAGCIPSQIRKPHWR